MEAKVMEMVMETEMEQRKVIPFRKELDLTLVHMVQAKTEAKADLNAREERARNYSLSCKRKERKANEDLECLLSGVSAFAFIGAIGFLMWFFM